MITSMGESYILNRLINANVSPITHIAIGKGGAAPQKNDTTLTQGTVMKECNSKIDLKNKRIILSAIFTQTELSGIREIGALSNDILVTHDLIDYTMDLGDTVTLKYVIEFTNTTYATKWVNYENNTYYCVEPNTVIGVMEKDINSGYKRVNTLTDLEAGSYYYDGSKQILYVITVNQQNPNNRTMQIELK